MDAVRSQLLAMLPYLPTIVVLAIISRDALAIRLNAPVARQAFPSGGLS